MPGEQSTPVEARSDDEAPSLTVKPETVCFIIVKAREFDAKDVVTDPDEGSNAADDSMISVLEDHPDDPVLEELTSAITDLSEDEQVDLVALAWLGRDDNTIEDWPTLRQEAARAHVSHGSHTASYPGNAAAGRLSGGRPVAARAFVRVWRKPPLTRKSGAAHPRPACSASRQSSAARGGDRLRRSTAIGGLLDC